MVLPLVRRRACAVSIAATLGTALVLGAATGAGAESLEYDLATTAFTSSADYTQPGFSPAETHDGNIEAAAPPYDGWAVDPFQGDPHQILWAFVAGEISVDAIQLIHVYDDNEVLHHFQLYYTTDSNPTLASTFQELTGLQMVLNTSGDGATIAGSEVQVTSTGAITTGEYRLSFDTVTATAIELRTFENSGTGNGNFVLSEISIRSSSPCANVTCSASDQCHAVGSCEPTTGLCTDPAVADGTFCDDGDPTTTSDQCTAGVCGSVSLSTISYVFVSDINGDGDATNDGIPPMGSVTLDGVNTSDLSDVSNVTLGAWEYSLIHGGTGEIVSYSSDDPLAVAAFNTDLMVITANSLSFDLAAIAVSPGPALFLRSQTSSGFTILGQTGISTGVLLEITSADLNSYVQDFYPPIGLLEFAAVPGPEGVPSLGSVSLYMLAVLLLTLGLAWLGMRRRVR